MKRIITCSDGTWNKPGTTDKGVVVKTNVEKMFNNICSVGKHITTNEDVKQLKAYDQGVGTGTSAFDKFLGGATGAGIDKNIKDMYTFICLNYQEQDEIWLFGFSRGAYTARSIAGFIRNCGILKPENIHLVDKAYNLYRDRNDYTSPDSDMMLTWRDRFCVEPQTDIMFIGVWDTVGSLGIPLPFFYNLNSEKYKFHDCTLSSHVKNAYHALAINEQRKLFSPTLWEKSDTVLKNSNHPQTMEQRWFIGVHSNIGGGYADAGLSDIALDWIMKNAENKGLCFNNPLKNKVELNINGELRDSITPMYLFPFPEYRTIIIEDKKYNQVIDESVWVRYNQHNKKDWPENIKAFE